MSERLRTVSVTSIDSMTSDSEPPSSPEPLVTPTHDATTIELPDSDYSPSLGRVKHFHRLSLDDDTPADKKARLTAPNAPKIGVTQTPAMSAGTPRPGLTPRMSSHRTRPAMHLDLGSLQPNFVISSPGSDSSGSILGTAASAKLTPNTLRAPVRPKLVSRWSSDDSESPPQRRTPGMPVTPGTFNALNAFGIQSSLASPWSGAPPTPSTPDYLVPAARSPLHSPSTEFGPMRRRPVRASSSLSRSASMDEPSSSSSSPMLGHDAAQALYDALLPGSYTAPPPSHAMSKQASLSPEDVWTSSPMRAPARPPRSPLPAFETPVQSGENPYFAAMRSF